MCTEVLNVSQFHRDLTEFGHLVFQMCWCPLHQPDCVATQPWMATLPSGVGYMNCKFKVYSKP